MLMGESVVEKNVKAQEILAEVKVLEKIITMYFEFCKNKFEQKQAKLLDCVGQMKVDCFYKPSVEALNTYVGDAKKYAEAYEAGKNIRCSLESIMANYNEIVFKYTLSEERAAYEFANYRGESSLNFIHSSEEYPLVMNMFTLEFFSKLKDNGIVFYVDNDEENKRLFELLKDLGIIKDDKEIAIYNYCIEYAKKNPELASKCFQSVDTMIDGLKK